MDAQPRAGVRACVRARVRAQDADSGVLIWERRFGDVRVLVCASTHVRTHAMRVHGAEARAGWWLGVQSLSDTRATDEMCLLL
jgi:hypothetical protein